MSILYKITNKQGKTSYLFGTLHIDDKAVVTLPEEVIKALDEATDFIAEVNIDSLQTSAISLMLATIKWSGLQDKYRNKIPKDYIESAQITLNKAVDRGILPSNLKGTNALAVTPLTLAQCMADEQAQKTNSPLDSQLWNYAKATNKTRDNLESIDEQFNALYGFHLNFLEQIEIYQFVKSELSKGKKFPGIKDIMHDYLQQDIQKLQTTVQIFPVSSEIPETVRRYNNGLIANRDLEMAKRMEPFLNKGNAFVAVGAGHLKGITEKLQNEGYETEPVSLGERIHPIGSLEIAAFRMIYTAMEKAQSSFFKKRGFIPDDEMTVSLQQIIDYTNTNKDSRSFKAWELAKKHYKNISSANNELLKSICQEGYAKSSSFFGLFRQTKTNLDDPRCIAEAAADTRTGTVRDILDGPRI